MTKIPCKTKTKNDAKQLRVKVLKPPFVDSEQLRQVLFARSKAVVL